jgi:hypothetical protein
MFLKSMFSCFINSFFICASFGILLFWLCMFQIFLVFFCLMCCASAICLDFTLQLLFQ